MKIRTSTARLHRNTPPIATALLLALALAAMARANNDVNLARAKGTLPLGSGCNGPFTIHKIVDGRTDAMGMWCSTGAARSFAGVQLGGTPVTFNTVRSYLFNGPRRGIKFLSVGHGPTGHP